MPICIHVSAGEWLVFVTARDERSRGNVLMCTMDGDESPLHIVRDWKVVMQPGLPGAFDESGVVASDARLTSEGIEMLFHGYRLRNGGGWWNAIGRALLSPTGEMRSRTSAPVIGLSDECPISVAYGSWDPADQDAIWFNSAQGFDLETSLPERYIVCRSLRGEIDAKVTSVPDGTFALSRPVVTRRNGQLRLLCSVRGDEYLIVDSPLANAFEPGVQFEAFMPAGTGGEVNATAYPYVVRGIDHEVILYNGDRYGATGFGVAVG